MKLYEVLYREIAADFLAGTDRFTQKELSERLHISIGNVNRALSKLEEINAVAVGRRSFRVTALDRLLLYWATHRKLYNDVIYKALSELSVADTEASLPNGIAFTAYTAYKKTYGNVPADYSEVFVYVTEAAGEAIRQRFPKQGTAPNLFVLRADAVLSKRIASGKARVVPVPNIFADLWNIKTWYAKEFTDALSKRLFG
ncbi:MAG: winged helix-turn-helix transcriptional regulator [Candidatus Marsarchaeota archaeon]|nr:winged helix-turn-helix transcriptional regulator [Candidatus Marsarchaeota archaeon]